MMEYHSDKKGQDIDTHDHMDESQKLSCQLKEASHTRPHTVRFHL